MGKLEDRISQTALADCLALRETACADVDSMIKRYLAKRLTDLVCKKKLRINSE